MHFAKKMCLMTLMALGLAGATIKSSAATVNATVAPMSITDLTDWVNKQFVVDKFDSSLGTLTSVLITLSGEIDGSATLININQNASANYAFQLQVKFESFIPNDSIPLVVQNTSGVISGTLAPGQTIQLTQITGSGSTFKIVNNGNNNLADFVGPGTFNVPTDAFGSIINTGSSNISLAVNSTATATLDVVYEYRPTGVPVPASVWSGGALLAGLVYRRFRKLA